nr:TetR/AcrR family transcriptional regulator [Mycolicibacterium malmesburyense]CRL69604.1 transcriptional regulator [Mycolicibacterium malmesburyense]
MEDLCVIERAGASPPPASSGSRAARRRPGRPTLSNEQLLDTALDLFLENGFERTSIEAISAAAGMAKRTVYARYEDKTSLFKAALTRAIEDWIVPVEQLQAVETDDFEETLLAIGRILVANVLRPGGLRLLRLTNAVSAQMPEIAAFNVQKGTEPTLAYLADLFLRRLGSDGISIQDAGLAAGAFIDLVPGGPANASARGVVLDEKAVDQHTRYCVRLFVHGLLPGDQQRLAAEAENKRLKQTIADALDDLERVRERLDQREPQ